MYCYALKINIYTQKFEFINPKTKMGVYTLKFFFWLPVNTTCKVLDVIYS